MDERKKGYARLLARCGLNVQKGQDVDIRCALDQPDFVTEVAEQCYEAGARRVRVRFSHGPIERLGYIYRTEDDLATLDGEEKAQWERRLQDLPCELWLDSDDPDGFSGTDSAKIERAKSRKYVYTKEYVEKRENRYQWCIAGVPGRMWAKKMFPGLDWSVSEEKLWELIMDVSRCTEDPLAEWERHNMRLKERCKKLNDLKLDRLHYESSNGTDFTVWLNEAGLFNGGSESTLSGVVFNPNIPSEEVFTSPKAGAAEGRLVATKPLSYGGKLIENFAITFRGGKAVKVEGEKNCDALEAMIGCDEGAARIGEVALISKHSPINERGVLFYNTLYDENASCHVALGRGFNECLKGYETMTQEEIERAGVNNSMIHTDFMIGSGDLRVTGFTRDGKAVSIFEDGDWVL